MRKDPTSKMIHWKDAAIHVIDFEGSRISGIIEYGIVTLKAGVIVETHTRLCQSKGPISQREFEQHGIHTEAINDQEPFDVEWNLLLNCRKTGFLSAHHAEVENRLLRHVWPYAGNVPNFLEQDQISIEWGPWIDTLQIYRHVFTQLKDYKLHRLMAVFGLDETLKSMANKYCPDSRRRYHCALYDALASALLLMHLGNLDGFESMTVNWLLEQSFSNTDRFKSHQQYTLSW